MGKPVSLNYDAEYPVESAPTIVESSSLPASMQGDPMYDYKPSSEKMAEMKGLSLPKVGVKDRVPREGVRIPKVNSDGVFKDFISGPDNEVIRNAQKDVILHMAKQIWEDDNKYREAWKEAKRIVEEATSEQLNDPDRKISDAVKLLKGRKPFSKKEALEKAEQQVFADN